MKLRMLAVGTRMPDWVETGCNEYAKRLPPELRIQVVEIPLGSRGKSQSNAKAIEIEGQALLKAIGQGFCGRVRCAGKDHEYRGISC